MGMGLGKVLILFVLTFSTLGKAETSQELSKKIKTILSPLGENVSFSFRDSKGLEVAEYRSDKMMSPASVAKLVSTGCSLLELGPAFTFDTHYGFTGKIQGDTLKGDFVITGSGDPSFVIEDLKEDLEKIRFLYDLKKIEGDLVFDASYLANKGIPISEGFEGDAGRSFTALITPTPINQNSFSLWLAPDPRGNKKVVFAEFPAMSLKLKLINQSKIGSAGVNVNFDPDTNTARSSGSMSADADPKGFYRSTSDAYGYFVKLFKRVWTELGGEWSKENYRIETAGVKSEKLWVRNSRSLSRILMDVNKFSLNFAAEQVLLAAGVKFKGRPASAEKSQLVLADCYQKLGLNPSGFAMANASGLSRETQIKSASMTQYLSAIERHAFASEFKTSLSLSGIDGTYRSKMKNYPALARVKTGTLKDVRSVAGYLANAQGTRSGNFALFFNNSSPSDQKILRIEAQVVDAIMDHLAN